MMMFYLIFALLIVCKCTGSGIVQTQYTRYFVDRLINLGRTNETKTVCFRNCVLLCERTADCVGLNFERIHNKITASRETTCRLQIAKENTFPKSFFPKTNWSYYGKKQNPLKLKDAIECDPVDPSLSYFCDKEPSTQQRTMNCTLYQRISYYIQTKTRVKPSDAENACLTFHSNATLARITDKKIQDWFCNILTAFLGTTINTPFTIGLYRKSFNDTWRYGSANHDLGPTPEDFYQNWYDNKYGVDNGNQLCVQMFSAAPYHFKWVIVSCDSSVLAYPLCEYPDPDVI